MIPKIKRISKKNCLRRCGGFKWIVVGEHGSDATKTLKQAFQYWLWHCGVPSKYCFKS